MVARKPKLSGSPEISGEAFRCSVATYIAQAPSGLQIGPIRNLLECCCPRSLRAPGQTAKPEILPHSKPFPDLSTTYLLRVCSALLRWKMLPSAKWEAYGCSNPH